MRRFALPLRGFDNRRVVGRRGVVGDRLAGRRDRFVGLVQLVGGRRHPVRVVVYLPPLGPGHGVKGQVVVEPAKRVGQLPAHFQ